jgi:hypothetical protein
MHYFANLNLLHLFNFYLASMFLLSTVRRLSQYRAVGALMVSAPKRWPRLLELMKKHKAIFFTWSTLRPAALVLLLLGVNLIASRLLWPQAELTAVDLVRHWHLVPIALATFAPMAGLDLFFLIRVGKIDQKETEEQLDKAESWLTGWKAPVVRILTLGYVDPRRMVSAEIQKTLTAINQLMNRNLYWMSGQMATRVLFGLTLWLTWAFYP